MVFYSFFPALPHLVTEITAVTFQVAIFKKYCFLLHTRCHTSEHVVQQLNPSPFPPVLHHTGDILALSINNLDSLVQKPLGCGEQNMIHFAPSIYVLQYLDMSTQDNKEIRTRALGYMMEGKQPLHFLESLTCSKCTVNIISKVISCAT